MTRPTTSPLLSHLPLSLLSLLLLLLPPLPLALADSACSSVNPNSDLCNEATCPSWEDCTSCTLGWAGGVPLPIYTCDRPLDPTPLDAGVVLAIVFSCVGGLMVLFYCCACRGVGCFRGGRHHRWWMRKRAEWWAACGGQRQVGVGVVYQQQTAVGSATSKVQMTQLQLQPMQVQMQRGYPQQLTPLYAQQPQPYFLQPGQFYTPGQPPPPGFQYCLQPVGYQQGGQPAAPMYAPLQGISFPQKPPQYSSQPQPQWQMHPVHCAITPRRRR